MDIETASDWAKNDPNELTSQFVRDAVDSGNIHEVNELFNGRIGFGTAGLRAKMYPGPKNMNDLVVLQTSQGLASYCVENHNSKKIPAAIVGYDHRACTKWNLSSERFAKITKLAFEHAGIHCILLDGFVPTPLVSYSIKHVSNILGKKYECVVGVMVTASHNPKEYDGYKVYLGDGCQIRPPYDTDIAASIIQPKNLKPWFEYAQKIDCIATDIRSTEKLTSMYFSALEDELCISQYKKSFECYESKTWKVPKVMYTAMHGVGTPFAKRAFRAFHLPDSFFCVCELQSSPDPKFPTVSFPNPEENGALEIAQKAAEAQHCDLVFANDPDADRLAVSERCRKTGKWTIFSGNQIGVLLGHWMWESVGKSSKAPVAMCASTVSSKMLGAIGSAEGFRFEETLPGFKWIGERSKHLREEGYNVLLGYEEAIGYCCGNLSLDKDGLSALGIFSEMTIALYQREMQILDQLEILYNKYGEFVSNNGYFYCYESENVSNIFNAIRNEGKYMSHVGHYKICSIRDLGHPGFDSSSPDKKPVLPTSKSSPILTIRFQNGCVAQFRASGTEPKFKYYIELPGLPGVPREKVEEELVIMSKVIIEVLLNPTKNGLIKPGEDL